MNESAMDKYLQEDDDEAKAREARYVGRSPLFLSVLRLARNPWASVCFIIVVLYVMFALTITFFRFPGLERAATEYHNGKQMIYDMEFLDGGKKLAIATEDNYLCVYDLATGRKTANLFAHTNKINILSLVPGTDLLLSAGEDSKAFLWDPLKKKEPLATFNGDAGPIVSLKVASDGKRAIMGTMDGQLYSVSLPGLIQGKKSSGPALAIAMFPDGSRFAAGDYDGTVAVRDTVTLEVLETFKPHEKEILRLEVSPDGKGIVSSSEDGTLSLWSFEKKKALWTVSDESGDASGAFTSLILSKDGTTFRAGTRSGNVEIRSLSDGVLASKVTSHSKDVFSLAWAPDGTLYSGGPEVKVNRNGGNDYAVIAYDEAAKTQKKTLKLTENLLFLPIGHPEHLFGTDEQGRDVLTRSLMGIKVALFLGFFTCIMTVPISIILGALAGFYSGWVDDIVQFLMAVITAIPGLLIILSLILVFGRSYFVIAFAFAVTGWVGLGRMIRGSFIQAREFEYVLAARALGASDSRIIFKHILPNVFHFVIISFVLEFLAVVTAEVFLAFVGLSVIGVPTWGSMITLSQSQIVNNNWQNLFGPTLFMFIFVVSLNIFGDALRDALDPKLRNQ